MVTHETSERKEIEGHAPGFKEGLHARPGRDKRDFLIRWREWGDDAFAEAAREGKLVLLDLTALWCHWCHVMDETTYSDDEVIRIINEGFIPLRVDADARPDVQDRYIDGGWPTTAILLPTAEVLASATYVRPDEMKRMLEESLAYYGKHKDEIAAKLVDFRAGLKKQLASTKAPSVDLPADATETVLEAALKSFDAQYGGFGDAPKFPTPDLLELMMRRYLATKNGDLFEMIEKTLRGQTGILDMVWGGFFRYSVKADWSEPHYEKILGANAQMMESYLDAYLLTGAMEHLAVVDLCLKYCESFWTYPQGGFCGSQDADVGSHYGSEPFIDGEDFFALSAEERKKYRMPFIDQRVYTSWNSMMVSAYLKASFVTRQHSLADFAEMTIERLTTENMHECGLFYRDQQQRVFGLLTDQAYSLQALIDAYQYTGYSCYLHDAEELADTVLEMLEDKQAGGFFGDLTSTMDWNSLLVPVKPFDENCIMARGLADLSRLSGEGRYLASAERALKLFAARYAERGCYAAIYALAVDAVLREPTRLVIVGRPDDETARAMREAALRRIHPRTLVATLDPTRDRLAIGAVEFPGRDETVAYVCEGAICGKPIADADALAERLVYEV